MRLIIDTLIAGMLVAILAGMLLHHRAQQEELEQYQAVHRALARLQEQVLYRGALDQEHANDMGFPPDVSPLWFNDAVPVNLIVAGRQPWIDIAPEGDMSDQPPDPVVTRIEQAGFWYNPNRGIVRARVPQQFTEQAAIELYNRLNGTAVRNLPRGIDESRRPLRHPLISAGEAEAGSEATDPTAATATADPPEDARPSLVRDRTTLVDDPRDENPDRP